MIRWPVEKKTMETPFLSADDEDGSSPALWAIPLHAPLTSGKVSEILLPALPEEVHFLPGNHPILSQNFKILDTELPLASWDLVEYSGQALGFLCGPHKDSLLNIEKNIHWVFENHKAFYSLDQTNHLEPHLERTFARGRMNQVQSETSKVVEGEYSFAPQAVNLPPSTAGHSLYQRRGPFCQSPPPVAGPNPVGAQTSS
jgi:hypothetical protein